MLPYFQVTFTKLILPLLHSIAVADKPGLKPDTSDITLKATQLLLIPESGTNVSVKLGYLETGIFEVFKGVANGIGFSGPPDKLFIQATGIGLSDDKRLQGFQTRTWSELLTLGQVLTDIIQGARFKTRVHGDLSGIDAPGHRSLDATC